MSFCRSLARRASLLVTLAFLLALSALAQTTPERTVRVTLLQLNDVYQISPVDKGMRAGPCARGDSTKEVFGGIAPQTDGRIKRVN